MLAPIRYDTDAKIVAIMLCIAVVLLGTGQVVDPRYHFYLWGLFITAAVAVTGWYYTSGQNRRPKWRIFLAPGGADGDAVDPQITAMRRFNTQMPGTPRRRARFEHPHFARDFMVHSLAYSVITVIFLFPHVESIAVCLYAAVGVTLAVLCAETINGFFEMGQMHAQAIQIGLFALFAILGFYVLR